MSEGAGAFYANTTRRNDGGSGTYPRYSLVYTERAASPSNTPTDEDAIWGFFSATAYDSTDAKFIAGVLNGVLPSDEWTVGLSNLSAGMLMQTDRVTVTPALLFDPQASAPALVTGNLYFDSGSGELKLYSGGWQTLTTGSGMTAHDLTGAYHTEDATGGAGNFLKADSATAFSWQVHGLSNTDVDAAATIHNLIDTTNHPVAGLTGGHFLKALTTTTYGFAAHGLGASDVGAYTTAEVDLEIDTDIATHAALATVHQDAPALIATHAALGDAHHTEAHVLATTGSHTGSLPLTDLASYVRGSIIIGGLADWEALAKGTINQVLTSDGTDLSWGDPAGMSAHDLVGSYHEATGLTAGHFLKATGTTTFAFGAHGLVASDVGAYTTAQVDSAIDTDIATHNDATYHYAQSSITTTGTIGTGIWQGSAISSSYLDSTFNATTVDCSSTVRGTQFRADGTATYLSGAISYGCGTIGVDARIMAANDYYIQFSPNATYCSISTDSPYFRFSDNVTCAGTLTVTGTSAFNGKITLGDYDDIDVAVTNHNTVGTSTSKKFLEMFASGFNTGDVVFGNKFVISEVERPDWNGDWDEPFEKVFAHHKDDGATPGLIFYNNNNDPIALLDEDGEFHVKGKIHECSDIFKTMGKLNPRVQKNPRPKKDDVK